MNIRIYSCLIIFTNFIFTFVNGNGIVTFKLLKCNYNEKFYYPNATCSIKSYDRKTKTINVFGLLKQPFDVLLFEAELQFKYNAAYRTAFKGKGDWCEIVKSPENPLSLQFIKILAAYSSELVKPCPVNKISISNYTFDPEVLSLSVFPSGDYKFITRVFDKNQEQIQNSTLIISFSSTNEKPLMGFG